MEFLLVAIAVAILNVPFGYWRAGEKKFSRGWMLAVHLPVPAVIAIRILSGLGWQPATFPLVIGAFFFGQLFGGMLRDRRRKAEKSPLTACLVWDLVRTCRGASGSRIR
jgi:hypothetical protein